MQQLVRQLSECGVDPERVAPIVKGEMLYWVVTSGEDAVRIRNAIHERVPDIWPVIVGSVAEVGQLARNLEYPWERALAPTEPAPEWRPDRVGTSTPARQIIEEGERLNALAWLRDRVASDPAYYVPPRGPWPATASVQNDFILSRDPGSGGYLPEVALALIPTRKSYEVPAYLRFGGWNACPRPAEHVGVLRRWHEGFGAELVGASTGSFELQVSQPPRDLDTALELAWEQFVYCPDVVVQGVETLEVLAASLVESKIWYFWWD